MKKNFLKTVGVLTAGLFLAVPLAIASSSAKASEAEAAQSDYYIYYYESNKVDKSYGLPENILDGDYSTGMKTTENTYVEIKRQDEANFLPKSIKLVFSRESGIIAQGRVRQWIPGGVGVKDYYWWEVKDEETPDYKIYTINFQRGSNSLGNVNDLVSNPNLQLMLDCVGTLQEVIINESEDNSLWKYDANFDTLSLDRADTSNGFYFNSLPSLFDGNQNTGIRFHNKADDRSYFDIDLNEPVEVKDIVLSIPNTSIGTANQLSPESLQIKYFDGSEYIHVTLNDSNSSGRYASMAVGNSYKRFLMFKNPTTAQKWRIYLGANSAWCTLTEIEFNKMGLFPQVSVTNSSGDDVTIPDSDGAKGQYAFMFDNDPTSFAWFGSGLNYVTYTYPSPVTAYGAVVALGNPDNDYFDGLVRYKDSNNKWVEIGSFGYNTLGQTVMFSDPITATEFQIASTVGSSIGPVGTWAAIKEFDLIMDVQPVGSWVQPYKNAYQTPLNMTDGDFDTVCWYDSGIGYEDSLVLDLHGNITVKDILLFQTGTVGTTDTAVPSTHSNDQLTQFRLEYYSSGSWVQINKTFIDTPELIYVFDTPVSASKIRVVNLDNTTNGKSTFGAVIREFQVNSLSNYLSTFNSNVVCDNGVTPPSTSGWDQSGVAFREMDEEIREYVKDYGVDSTVLGEHVEKYDYIIDKYGTTKYPNYIKRGELERTGRVSPVVSIFGTLGDNNILLPVIILVAVVSVSLIGFVVYRKKRI